MALQIASKLHNFSFIEGGDIDGNRLVDVSFSSDERQAGESFMALTTVKETSDGTYEILFHDAVDTSNRSLISFSSEVKSTIRNRVLSRLPFQKGTLDILDHARQIFG